jgi:hypothetical protein
MLKSYGEPWKVWDAFDLRGDNPGEVAAHCIGSHDYYNESRIYSSHGHDLYASEETFRRVCACINACAGISTDDLENSGSLAKVLADALTKLNQTKVGLVGPARK